MWKLTALRLVFDTAKSSARLDDAATNPSTRFNSPVYRTHPYGYNFFVQFYPYGLEAAAGNHASIMFAFSPGNFDGLLKWPFSKTIHLSMRDQLDPLNTWTITSAPSERISFRQPTRKPLPTLMNFNFFPHSKMFSKIENSLLINTLYLDKNSPTYATLKAPHLPHLNHDAFYRTPQSSFNPFNPSELSRYS